MAGSDMVAWMRRRRPEWRELDEFLQRVDSEGWEHLSMEEIERLLCLFRSASGDLALARSRYPGTTLLIYLQRLVQRAHQRIYRAGGTRDSWRQVLEFVGVKVPELFARHRQEIAVAAVLFAASAVCGFLLQILEPRLASFFLGRAVVEQVENGSLWISQVFGAVPGSVAGAMIAGNNLSVVLLAFLGGLTLGVMTVYLLVLNGMMLGSVLALCAMHNQLETLGAFLVGHGFLELTVMVMSAGAGFVMARGFLAPGRWSRREAMVQAGADGLRMVTALIPAIVAAALVETYLSPWAEFPVAVRLSVGLGLWLVLVIYLFVPRRDFALALKRGV